MPSVLFFRFRFTSSWSMLVLSLSLFLLFMDLGFWQIHRAQEKKNIITTHQMQQNLNPVLWRPNPKLPVPYERIQLKGRYVSQTFLLDNQHHQHQFGYDVLSPFELNDGSVVLIDRGWVEGDRSRRVFPKVLVPKNLIQLEGSVYFPSKKQWVLGPILEKKENNTLILECFDEQLVSQLLQKTVYPFIIRLDEKDIHGFIREWELVTMPPQRHLAYALQWFVMAFVILIIFLALNLKKKNEETIQ
jgi:surfeit locus 1 family protein